MPVLGGGLKTAAELDFVIESGRFTVREWGGRIVASSSCRLPVTPLTDRSPPSPKAMIRPSGDRSVRRVAKGTSRPFSRFERGSVANNNRRQGIFRYRRRNTDVIDIVRLPDRKAVADRDRPTIRRPRDEAARWGNTPAALKEGKPQGFRTNRCRQDSIRLGRTPPSPRLFRSGTAKAILAASASDRVAARPVVVRRAASPKPPAAAS